MSHKDLATGKDEVFEYVGQVVKAHIAKEGFGDRKPNSEFSLLRDSNGQLVLLFAGLTFLGNGTWQMDNRVMEVNNGWLISENLVEE